jgi:alanyl-tRNA synthetase
MTGTYKLYNSDPYLKDFEATVVSIDSNRLELDKTAFYPEGGGQVGDTGIICDSRVVDTQMKDGRVIHLLEVSPEFRVGDIVECKLDWERRYRIMRLHSAAHIMEHFLFKRLGKMERVGSRVDEAKDRADYSYEGRLPADELERVGDEVNRFIDEGHTIEILSDPERPGIRIWSLGEIEMLCGGTHVSNTREIGRIKLRRRNPGRGVERVETSLL